MFDELPILICEMAFLICDRFRRVKGGFHRVDQPIRRFNLHGEMAEYNFAT
jgi:hypothetical protein